VAGQWPAAIFCIFLARQRVFSDAIELAIEGV